MSDNYVLLKTCVEQSIQIFDTEWINKMDAISQSAVFFDEITPELHLDLFAKSGDDEQDSNFKEILKRIKIGPQSIILLTGYIGTGKSTTLRFLQHEITNSKNCPCDYSEACPLSRPLIIYKSFQKDLLDDDSFTLKDAKDSFIESMNSFLLAAIENQENFKKDSELIELKDYWDYGISLSQSNKFINPAFSWIIGKLGSDRYNLDKRKQILESLKDLGGEYLLIYLLTYLGYLTRKMLKNKSDCIVIMLDDLDHSSILIQDAIVETLSRFNHDKLTDPQMVIAIRPESSAGKNFGTFFLDKVPHIPPEPYKVLRNRILYAIEHFEYIVELLNKTDSDTEDSKILYNYLLHLNKFISDNNSFQTFLRAIANGSSRLAIYTSDGLLKLSRNKMKDEINIYDIIRSCITRGKGYYIPLPQKQHPVKNIFSLDGINNPIHLLIKLRILKILKKETKLSIIRKILNKFGYEHYLQLAAVNELLAKPWSLVFSTGSEKYININHYLESSNDNLSRTDLGNSYGKELWNKMYYNQEMMFDCWLFKDRLIDLFDSKGKISDSSVYERFLIYNSFLKTLLDQEFEDGMIYLAKSKSLSEYTDYFGDELYSFRMIKDANSTVGRIFSKEGEMRKAKIDSLIKSYTELENWAFHRNETLLNIEFRG